MIPSTTKLALLSGVVLIVRICGVAGVPVLYDQRQDGTTNVFAEVEDFTVILIPTKELINTGVDLVSLSANSYLTAPTRMLGTDRVPAKVGFVRPEKSPYKVDLEKSQVPLTKLPEVEPKPVEPEKKNVLAEAADTPAVVIVTDNKTVKKELKPEKKAESAPAKKEVEKTPSEKIVTTVEGSMKTTAVDTLTLVGEGLEECGPDGRRNSEGMCIY